MLCRNRTALAIGSVRGFTLTELMVVVAIMGILATIGIVAFRNFVYSSKSAEALAMIQSIRAAEERWRAENLTYLNVSTTNTWYPRPPEERRESRFFDSTHADDPQWRLLNPTETGNVEMGYMVHAGRPLQQMPEPHADLDLPNDPRPPVASITQHWYMIQALGDSDGDGVFSGYLTTSINNTVIRHNDGE